MKLSNTYKWYKVLSFVGFTDKQIEKLFIKLKKNSYEKR